MKLALLLCLGLLPGMRAEGPTKGERERAMSELHATRKMFLDSIAGLSKAQWEFKPDEKTWSVAQCAEHIAISEDTLFELVTKRVMGSPAAPEKRAEVAGKDEKIMTGFVDRSTKFQAPEVLRPTRRWATQEELVQHFKESRDRTIRYIETTDDALRDHFTPHPVAGLMDGYQWLLAIAAHSSRHTLQILEVKQNPAFPKN